MNKAYVSHFFCFHTTTVSLLSITCSSTFQKDCVSINILPLIVLVYLSGLSLLLKHIRLTTATKEREKPLTYCTSLCEVVCLEKEQKKGQTLVILFDFD